MELELGVKETAFLTHVLERELGDLRAEISRTDSSSFKQQLHEERDLLVGLLDRLCEPARRS